MTAKEFGTIILDCLEVKSMTRLRLARFAGCSVSTLTRTIQGKGLPRPATIKAIGRELGLSDEVVEEAIAESRRIQANATSTRLKWKKGWYRCQIFSCHRRKGNVCCANCEQLSDCDVRCLNSPERCGQSRRGYRK